MMLAMFMALSLSCRTETELGECVGIQQEDLKSPNLVYDVSVRNVIIGGLFFPTIFAPAVVVFANWECPVKQKITHLNVKAGEPVVEMK